MKTFKFVLILAVSVILCIPNVYANSFDVQFGDKITINDNRTSGIASTTNWYNQVATLANPGGEDQEVEPGMDRNQNWDLEGFLLKNKMLSIVGGFDLRDGYNYGGYTYKSGDIFIDVVSDTSGKTFNGYTYEYALDMDYSTGKYNVVMMSNSATVDNGKLAQNTNFPYSAPYRYLSAGIPVTGWQNRSFTYYDFGGLLMSDAMTGYLGTNHNALTVDLGFLPGGTNFISHFTIECGNDNLMGQGTAVPEPATLLLLGLGLVGLGVARKFKK